MPAAPDVFENWTRAPRPLLCQRPGRAGGGEVPFLVGGAYAFAHYTGIVRHTKDLDLFVRRPTPRAC